MATCMMQPVVDAHFAGTISPAEERRMRAHLQECEPCTSRYQRRLVLAMLDPEALDAESRLGHGLGLSPAKAATSTRRWVSSRTLAAGVSTLAAAAVIALWAGSRPPSTGEFTARGSLVDVPESHVQIFQARDGSVPVVAASSLGRKDELAFSYVNGAGKQKLMIFAVDEHGHVFWYHPAWLRASDNPEAVSIERDSRSHELREAVAQDLDGRTLEVHALFVDEPVTVKTIEARIDGRAAPLGALAVEGEVEQVTTLAVAP